MSLLQYKMRNLSGTRILRIIGIRFFLMIATIAMMVYKILDLEIKRFGGGKLEKRAKSLR